MNDKLKIESILGNATQHYQVRASRDGKQFEALIPAPAWSETTVERNGSVTDTVHQMQHIIRHYAWQAAKVAPLLKGKDLYDTCRNIWNFLYQHIKYKEDDEGKEQLRTFCRSWAQRLTRGIDCDDFSIAAACLLRCIYPFQPFYIRIARYAGKDHFQHVYIVVPQKGRHYITIDAVLDQFDTEKEPAETKDFSVMSANSLNGIDISVLNGVEDDTLNEISGILTGIDFHDASRLEGLGYIPSREMELQAIRKHLERTRRLVHRHPHLIRNTEHPASFLGMVDYALKYWDTDKREEALGVLAGEEDRLNTLEGLGDVREDHEDVTLFYGLNGSGGYDVLGKAKRQRKFFAKVKQAVKKAGQGIKKIAKTLIRFNPLTITIRAAVLLALKVNLFKVSSKLKWGYLTEAEAQKHGFDMGEWRKMKGQLAKAEKLFVNTLQGKAENFKRAILTGRAGGLSGTGVGLGVVVAAATAASTTAAVPFITKIINLLKNINFKKLIAHVDLASLKKGKKQAEDDTPTEDGGSSIPEGGGDPAPSEGGGDTSPAPENTDTGADASTTPVSNDESTANDSATETPAAEDSPSPEDTTDDSNDTNDNTTDTGNDSPEENTDTVEGTDDTGDIVEKVKNGLQVLNTFKDKFKNRKKKKGSSTTPPANNAQKASNNNPNNLPALRKQNLPIHTASTASVNPNLITQAMLDAAKQNKVSTLDKIKTWVQENPWQSLLIGVGTSVVIASGVSLLVNHVSKKRKPQAALGGTKGKGKKKTGKAKTHAPKALNGIKKQAKKKSKPKAKAKAKGKSRNAKRVKL